MARGEPASKPAGSGPGERLAIEAAQKDPARFGELYEENFDRIYAFVARRVRDRDEAEDLTAEVFHRALENLKQFQWRGVSLAAWLYRIAANAIVDRSKDASRRAARERTLEDLEARRGEDPAEDVLEAVEQRARLFRTVELLPADQRRVIAMRFGQEKTIREISRELRRSEGAIKQLQLRGLQNLRARMGKRNG
jgi:RNA polymerase sigma-70 factor (ECF subfamily)